MVYNHRAGVLIPFVQKYYKLIILLVAALFVSTTLALTLQSKAATDTVYDNLPSPMPGNVASLGYEATSTSEFGGAVEFAGTNRLNPKISVLMSSWACESGAWNANNCSSTPGSTFNHPITIHVYNLNPDNSVGTEVVSSTVNFDIPYRPSADPVNCTGTNDGKWYDGTVCNNGYGNIIEFNLPGTTLPDKAIITVSYNTSHYGYSPIGNTACNPTPQGCPYDSLNVGANSDVSAGTPLPSENDAYLNSSWVGAYCDGGTAGTGTLRLDPGCWNGYLPTFKVEADAPVVRMAEITSPLAGSTQSGSVNFTAYLQDDDPDNIQWAVRQGTCAAGTGTVFGNVDGHNDVATIDQTDLSNQTFAFTAEMSGLVNGTYCFVYNPVEDQGETNIRLTSEFTLKNIVKDKDDCKDGKWRMFTNPKFKNQGECIKYFNQQKNHDGEHDNGHHSSQSQSNHDSEDDHRSNSNRFFRWLTFWRR